MYFDIWHPFYIYIHPINAKTTQYENKEISNNTIYAVTLIAATIDYAFGQFGLTPLKTEEKILPTYLVRIPPGAAQQDSPEHYYPPNIATLLAQQ